MTDKAKPKAIAVASYPNTQYAHQGWLSEDQRYFYLNDEGKLRNVSKGSGADFPGNSRAAVYTDIDGDGDLDVVINNFHGPATVLRNQLPKGAGNWIVVQLEGDPAKGANRDAIGARILATTPAGKRIWREVHGGSGYLSCEPKAQHLGLGTAGSVDLEIRWPDGSTQTVKDLKAGRRWHIKQMAEPVSAGAVN